MNAAKKRMVTLISVVSLLPTQSSPVLAATVEYPPLDEYQAIIDRLSMEYGLDVRFVTPEESAEHGIPLPDPRRLGTLAEFEAGLRAEVEAEIPRAAEAERLSALASLNASATATFVDPVRVDIIEDGRVVGFMCLFRRSDLSGSDEIGKPRGEQCVNYVQGWFIAPIW
jgi:hypothetical protein